MQYCSIIDQHADSIEFAAGPTLTKSINDLRRFLVSLEPPRESPLARALHGLCLAGWGEPTANLLPYYPNGSPNDGREQTPPSQILSAFFPQYLRGKCEPSNEACPQEDSSTCKDNGDLYPGVPNIKAPPAPADPSVRLNPFSYIGNFPATVVDDECDRNGKVWGIIEVDLTTDECQKDRSDRFCPHCGAMGTLGQHKKQTIDLVYVTVSHKPYKLRVTIPVWRCSKCGAIRREPNPFRFGRTKLTKQVVRDYAREFVEYGFKGSVHALAIRYNISDQRAAKLIDFFGMKSRAAFASPLVIERLRNKISQLTDCNFIPPTQPMVCLLIDEIATCRQEFITVVISGKERKFYFYAPGRGAEGMHKLVAWGGDMIPEDVMAATDMSAVFLPTLRKYRPDGTYVNDCFHHLSNAKKHLRYEVKTVASLLDSAGRKDDAAYLRDRKTKRVLFATDIEALSEEDRARFDKAIALHERLPLIRNCYVELYSGLMAQSVEEAMEHMQKHMLCCDQVQELRIAAAKGKIKQHTALSDYLIEKGLKPKPEPDTDASAPLTIRNAKYNKPSSAKSSGRYCPAATLGSTTLEHLEELLNYVRVHITTGPIEGFNNLLKVLKRSSFGIKRVDRFMCRLKLVYEQDFDLDALVA